MSRLQGVLNARVACSATVFRDSASSPCCSGRSPAAHARIDHAHPNLWRPGIGALDPAPTSHPRQRHCTPGAARIARAATSFVTPAEAEGAPPPPQQRRRLILLRHADSESGGGVRDHDRPISHQGRREAARIGARLAQLGWLPDLIIASNSRRTRQTLDAMGEAEAQLAEADAHFLGSLYTVAALDGQTRQHIEDCIRSMANDAAHMCVMCVGHNKGWEEAACSWARDAVRLNTACAALFEAAGRTWADALAPETEWQLVDVLTP